MAKLGFSNTAAVLRESLERDIAFQPDRDLISSVLRIFELFESTAEWCDSQLTCPSEDAVRLNAQRLELLQDSGSLLLLGVLRPMLKQNFSAVSFPVELINVRKSIRTVRETRAKSQTGLGVPSMRSSTTAEENTTSSDGERFLVEGVDPRHVDRLVGLLDSLDYFAQVYEVQADIYYGEGSYELGDVLTGVARAYAHCSTTLLDRWIPLCLLLPRLPARESSASSGVALILEHISEPS